MFSCVGENFYSEHIEALSDRLSTTSAFQFVKLVDRWFSLKEVVSELKRFFLNFVFDKKVFQVILVLLHRNLYQF